MNEAENQNFEKKENLTSEENTTTEPQSELNEQMPEDSLKEGESVQENISKSEEELAEAKDKYLRLYADFENFRRRTAKEKIELISNANEDLIKSLLTVIDDFERALKSMENAQDITAIKEGVLLIYNKLTKNLESKGLKLMESSIGKPFDLEKHESITQIPAPSEDMKGKVIDEIEKGYLLNDKIIRFAKVVTGS